MISPDTQLATLVEEHPYMETWLEQNRVDVDALRDVPLNEVSNSINMPWESFRHEVESYILEMQSFLGLSESGPKLQSIRILPGQDKSGAPENFEAIDLNLGDILTIVGPTGSGKSRLLADIEWMAQGDTPTARRILINGEPPATEFRFGGTPNLVAQLSQNMNFVMDLSVEEFLEMHAASRQLPNPGHIIERVLKAANDLAGERFNPDMPITSLSGGQSRALMIADTAILSQSPIVLIDEIENAGIQRKKALELLVGESKIVLMATHDPVLALMGQRRIVIKNGGISKLLETTSEERKVLAELEAMDISIQRVRQQLRLAQPITLQS